MNDETNNPIPAEGLDGPPIEGGDVPIEAQPVEIESPRRAASAEFVVEGDVGSDAALREAMDPANQSLAEALRLSYRVMQTVIVVLIALFLVSGFQRVEPNQSGVMLRFGRIVESENSKALQPGLRRNLLPYPAGEFIIFDVGNRTVDLGTTYWPYIPPGLTLERAIDRSNIAALKPGQVGTLLMRDGDLAHVRIRIDYEINDPVRFVETVPHEREEAGRLVAMAVERGTVHVAASMTVQELVDSPEVAAAQIRASAQALLDKIDCGITVIDVSLPEAMPPFAIVRAFRDAQNAREEARREIEKARQSAAEALIKAAGPNWRQLATMVARYEEAEDLGDSPAATALLDEVNAFLESDQVSGDLNGIIRRAQGFDSSIELNLGNEARRFRHLLPSYRDQPQLTIIREWMSTISEVLAREDVEIFRVPAELGQIQLRIRGLDDIQKIRRRFAMERREQRAISEALSDYSKYLLRAQDWEIGQSKPILQGTDGRITPKGSDR